VSIYTRRLHNRLTMMYKVTLMDGWSSTGVPYHLVPRLQYTARGHPRQFQRFQPAVDALKYAFIPRIIPAWNALPLVVVEADSLDTFKRYLSLHQQFWSSASCTMYIVHICSTTHLFVVSFYSMHLFMPLLITVAKIPPVVYYPSKDVTTILSRSRSRSRSLFA